MVSGRNYEEWYKGLKHGLKKEIKSAKQGLRLQGYRKSLMRALSESRKGMKHIIK